MPITKTALIATMKETLTQFRGERASNEIYDFQCRALESMLAVLEKNIPTAELKRLLANAFSVGHDSIKAAHQHKLLAHEGTPYAVLASKLNRGAAIPTRRYLDRDRYRDYSPAQSILIFLSDCAAKLDCTDWDTVHYVESSTAKKDLKARAEKSARRQAAGSERAAAAAGGPQQGLVDVATIDLEVIPVAAVHSDGGRQHQYVLDMCTSVPVEVGQSLVERVRANPHSAAALLALVSKTGRPIAVSFNDALLQLQRRITKILANIFAMKFIDVKKRYLSAYMPRTNLPYTILNAWRARSQADIFTPDALYLTLKSFGVLHRATVFSPERQVSFPEGTSEGALRKRLEKEYDEVCALVDLKSYLGFTEAAHRLVYRSFQGSEGGVRIPLTEGFAYPAAFVRAKRKEYNSCLTALVTSTASTVQMEKECYTTLLQALDIYKRYAKSLLEKSVEPAPFHMVLGEAEATLSYLPQRVKESYQGPTSELDGGSLCLPNTSDGDFFMLTEGGLLYEKVLADFMDGLEQQLADLFLAHSTTLQAFKVKLSAAGFEAWVQDLREHIIKYLDERVMLNHSRCHLQEDGTPTDLDTLVLTGCDNEETYAAWYERTVKRDECTREQADLRIQGLSLFLAQNFVALETQHQAYIEAKKTTEKYTQDVSLLDLSANPQLIQALCVEFLAQAESRRDQQLWNVLAEWVKRSPGSLDESALSERGVSLDGLALPSVTTTDAVALSGMGPLAMAKQKVALAVSITPSHRKRFESLILQGREVLEAYFGGIRSTRLGGFGVVDAMYHHNYGNRNIEGLAYAEALCVADQNMGVLEEALPSLYQSLLSTYVARKKGLVLSSNLHGPMYEKVIQLLRALCVELRLEVVVEERASTPPAVGGNLDSPATGRGAQPSSHSYQTASVMGGTGAQRDRVRKEDEKVPLLG